MALIANSTAFLSPALKRRDGFALSEVTTTTVGWTGRQQREGCNTKCAQDLIAWSSPLKVEGPAVVILRGGEGLCQQPAVAATPVSHSWPMSPCSVSPQWLKQCERHSVIVAPTLYLQVLSVRSSCMMHW